MKEPQNLMDGLLSEMNRVRELIQDYKELPNNAGWFGVSIMTCSIKFAEQAISENDVIKMLRVYETLKNHE
jgi:hypothetical protein